MAKRKMHGKLLLLHAVTHRQENLITFGDMHNACHDGINADLHSIFGCRLLT
jgi:hypothetical protein